MAEFNTTTKILIPSQKRRKILHDDATTISMGTLVRFSDTDESILDTKTVVDYNDGALSQYEVPVVLSILSPAS